MRARAGWAGLCLAVALCGCGAKTLLDGTPEPVPDPVSDASSYTRYTSGASPLSFIDACQLSGHSTVLSGTDDATSNVSLPFPFLFYRARTSTAWVSSNGTLGFGAPSPSFSATCLPGPTQPTAAVFALWTDLYTRSGVCLGTTGNPGSRRFVATWSDAHFCCSDDPSVHLTFSVVLSEGSNIVDVLFSRLDTGPRGPGAAATVGVQNDTGTVGTQVQCGSTGGAAISAGSGVRFTPVP